MFYVLKIITLIFSIFLLFSTYSFAANDQGVNILFKGVVYDPPPCQFNDEKDMFINFEKVGVNKVDGINYQKKISISVTCTSQATLLVSLNGDAANLDTLQTNQGNLGIKLSKDGSSFKLNTMVIVSSSKPLEFTFVPVKLDVNKPLDSGGFTAVLTLISKFQ